MIIGLSGKKHSGKNTIANVLHGIVLKNRGMIIDYKIATDGKLWVKTTNTQGSEGWGEFDIERKDSSFLEWAEPNMYPYIKTYSFAGALKWLAVDLFNIPAECCFGTEEQKNQKHEHLLWENMPGVMTPTEWSMRQGGVIAGYNQNPQDFGIQLNEGPMTAREFLQVFGTDICRGIWEPVWVNKCIKDIQREGTLLAIITDVRFPNEVDAIRDAKGVTLRLTRQVFDDGHTSETALDDYSFTEYLDNNNDSIESTIAKAQGFFTSLNKGD